MLEVSCPLRDKQCKSGLVDATPKDQYKRRRAGLNLSSKYSQLGHRGRCPPSVAFCAMLFRFARDRIMRHSIGLRVIRLLAALITAAAISWAAQAQDRVALVVGNSKYLNANGVPNAVNDARVMARALREIGFVVADGFDLPAIAWSV